MSLDPRTPVLVGAGIASQRSDDPTEGTDAIGLMRLALDAAAADVGPGGAALLDRVDEVAVPEGIWVTRDPGRLVLGGRSPGARSVLAGVGVLQQTLMTRAAASIRDGAADVVVLCGGEAKWRSLRAQITGVTPPPLFDAPGGQADVALMPAGDIHNDLELHRGLANPTHQYAVMEAAIGRAAGRTPGEHAEHIAELVSGLSDIAAANPDAWNRQALSAAEVLAAPLVAEPYTKPSCSQWNVDQAAAFLLCSAGTAAALGIARDRWVFPIASAESNLMIPLTERAEMHRSPAAHEIGRSLTELGGHALHEVDLLEVYSCFPAAIQIQAAELGLGSGEGRPLSVTGGMHFAGGPLNSFTFQALARMVPLLREAEESTALITSVSGMMTKVGGGTWSTRPPQHGFRDEDVTSAATATTATRRVSPDHEGTVTIAAYTVGHSGGAPTDAVIVGDTSTGERAVATSTDPGIIDALREGDWCGERASVLGAAILGIGR